MRSLHPLLNKFADDYGSQVTFIFIYILEAHAADEWRVDSINTEVNQHKNIQDRAQAAQVFLSKFPLCKNITFVLDNEHNEFNEIYSSWPFRYWIINSDNTLRTKMMCKNIDEADIGPLESFLRMFKKLESRK